ncbi:MAG TPA: TRAP transporter substrate-binding protein DctP [Gammaproteobacteria bacterium]|nr:TRAP transporter substrate-binding protein DctP [Gammaproteobacteria bacterium]
MSAGAAHAAQYHWRFALEEIKGSVQDHYAQQFKKLIERRTHGKVQVTIYPYGALGTSSDLTEQVQNGILQFAFASPGHLGSVVPESQIFSLHFLFPKNEDAIEKILSSSPALYNELGKAYLDKQLKLLAIIPEGWMVWTSNKPLRTPADFKGFKIRTMVSPLVLADYRAYGANPTPMAYSDVYSGLQLHMIDGEVNPVFAIEEMGFYEVQKYMTFAYHLPFVTTLVTNPQFFDGLPKNLQQTVLDVKKQLDGYIFKVQKRLNKKRLKIIQKKSDIKTLYLTDAERAAFRKDALPVRKQYVKLAGPRGKKILNTLEQEIAAATGKSDEKQTGAQ